MENRSKVKKGKFYKLSQAEYRKMLRNEDRLRKIKKLVDEVHRITRQIK